MTILIATVSEEEQFILCSVVVTNLDICMNALRSPRLFISLVSLVTNLVVTQSINRVAQHIIAVLSVEMDVSFDVLSVQTADICALVIYWQR